MKTFLKFLAIALTVFSLNAFACVITIGFDDLTLDQPWNGVSNAWTDVPANYHGLVWTGWEAMSRTAYNAVYSQNDTGLPSDPNFAYSGHDTATLTIGGGQFYLEGISLSSWGGNLAAPGATTSVTIEGWLNGQLVEVSHQTIGLGWSNVPFPNHQLVDRVEFLPEGPNAGYFRADNVKVSSTPEPASIALLAIGLAALGAKKRKKS